MSRGHVPTGLLQGWICPCQAGLSHVTRRDCGLPFLLPPPDDSCQGRWAVTSSTSPPHGGAGLPVGWARRQRSTRRTPRPESSLDTVTSSCVPGGRLSLSRALGGPGDSDLMPGVLGAAVLWVCDHWASSSARPLCTAAPHLGQPQPPDTVCWRVPGVPWAPCAIELAVLTLALRWLWPCPGALVTGTRPSSGARVLVGTRAGGRPGVGREAADEGIRESMEDVHDGRGGQAGVAVLPRWTVPSQTNGCSVTQC